ncbi:CoA ester lyase [Leisingera daeponensis]|uniref:CoA ester lyase n=1 Tax=Leisingera daeponensis TaxID=405746 RepID=A0ABS7NIP0_9RHOB|nr:CoA ester lyase [Leisingera daeponensis]
MLRAQERGADAVILDLEDSVPEAEKQAAREALPGAVAHLAQFGLQIVVRVNSGLGACSRDLEAAALPGVSALIVPKAASPGQMVWIDDYLLALEAQVNLPLRGIGLIALVESAFALQALPAIAKATPRMRALALGTEDFSNACGHDPTPESLTAPCQQLVWAARSAGLEAVGLPDSIGHVQDRARFEAAATRARALGMNGILCIHPVQVALANKAFQPDEAELAHARRILSAFEAAGRGAVMVDGEMVDPPVAQRARAMLEAARLQKIPA